MKFGNRPLSRIFIAIIASLLFCDESVAQTTNNTDQFPPHRFITSGPRHHWFGYYDKDQFDASGRYVLSMEVDFEHRSPRPDDIVYIGMVDLQNGNRWIHLGQTTAWNWQQGCMLQWLPGSTSKIIWNTREQDHYSCVILDVKTEEIRKIPHPVYSISPDGKSAVTPDFRRIADVRPGYGYDGIEDPFADQMAPKDTGIFHINLETGESKLIISLDKIAKLGEIPNNQPDIKHYFNHLLFSPDGRRFIALHRWRYPNGKRLTRLITANIDGSDIRIIIPNGYASHFIWRDPEHILSQAKNWCGIKSWGNFLFEDREQGKVVNIGFGVLDPYGHLSYLPGNQWILNDTYPQGAKRMQTPHLYHIATKRRIDLGHFHLPKIYSGEWRVDTHPRLSRDGKHVCIDAVDGNNGRQLCLIDISHLIQQ